MSIDSLDIHPTLVCTCAVAAIRHLLSLDKSLRCCDEETGRCASDMFDVYVRWVYALDYAVLAWCRSTLWISIRHVCTCTVAAIRQWLSLDKSLRCCDEETGRFASNIVDRCGRLVYALDHSALAGVDRLSGYPSDTSVYMYPKAFVEFVQEFEVL